MMAAPPLLTLLTLLGILPALLATVVRLPEADSTNLLDFEAGVTGGWEDRGIKLVNTSNRHDTEAHLLHLPTGQGMVAVPMVSMTGDRWSALEKRLMLRAHMQVHRRLPRPSCSGQCGLQHLRIGLQRHRLVRAHGRQSRLRAGKSLRSSSPTHPVVGPGGGGGRPAHHPRRPAAGERLGSVPGPGHGLLVTIAEPDYRPMPNGLCSGGDR
jgi:hypothetical protein